MISTQFLQRCQAGDDDAIQTLVRSHQRGVFQLALSIIDDGESTAPDVPPLSAPLSGSAAEQAEQATRETFIAALDRLGRYREDTPFEVWLYRVAIQVSLRRYRRWKSRRFWTRLFGAPLERLSRLRGSASGAERAQVPGAGASRPVSAVSETRLGTQSSRSAAGDAELWAAVRRLDEKLRLPVVLRYYHDFPISQIARMLRISEGAVHARLDAARERIAGGKAGQ